MFSASEGDKRTGGNTLVIVGPSSKSKSTKDASQHRNDEQRSYMRVPITKLHIQRRSRTTRKGSIDKPSKLGLAIWGAVLERSEPVRRGESVVFAVRSGEEGDLSAVDAVRPWALLGAVDGRSDGVDGRERLMRPTSMFESSAMSDE